MEFELGAVEIKAPCNLSVSSLSSTIQYYFTCFVTPAVERSFCAACMDIVYNLLHLALMLKDDKRRRRRGIVKMEAKK